mgnify:CR=1 FL=1
MSYAREILKRCSQDYSFDFEEACQRFSLREEDLPVPLFDHASPPHPPAAKNDMISNLLSAAEPAADSDQVSPNTIRRKRAARMTPEEKAELGRMKEEEKLSKKLAKEEKKKQEAQARLQQKELKKQSKNAIRSAEKAEKAALKALSKLIKLAEKAAKAKKTKDPTAPKRAPSAYILFSTETRPLVKQQMPELAAKEIMSELAKRWKALSDEDRKPYVDLAQAAKLQHSPRVRTASPPPTPTASSPPQTSVAPLDDEQVTVEQYAELRVQEEDEEDEEDEEEEEQEVDQKMIGGVMYLVDPKTGETFDSESHEPVGIYDSSTDTIATE